MTTKFIINIEGELEPFVAATIPDIPNMSVVVTIDIDKKGRPTLTIKDEPVNNV